MLTQVWQETLPRETLSFDVLQLPRQPAQLLTIDEVRIHFRVWDGGQWRTLRTTTHMMQRDLYALHPAHDGKTRIYTDGGGWIYTEKEIISDEPTRTVPIGRLVDKEGVARIICFDHQEQAPYYYVLEKPLLNDQFYLAPDDLLGDEIQSLVMQVPRLGAGVERVLHKRLSLRGVVAPEGEVARADLRRGARPPRAAGDSTGASLPAAAGEPS
jgi:hypothetical protein